METLRKQMLDRIRGWGRGAVFTPKDFLDLGSREAVDQVLHRLLVAGRIRRIARGLYHFPKANARLGIDVPPDLDAIAHALGRQTGSRVAPSGAVAANRLGLSTQVAATPVYLSDGRTRSVRVGPYTIHLKHVSPKKLPPGGPMSAMVFQALDFIGRDAIDDRVVRTLRQNLTPAQRREMLKDARYAPAWIANVARSLAATRGAKAHG